MRSFSSLVFKAFCGSLMLACCTANTPEATSSTARAPLNPPPQQLPSDYQQDSAPKPPPNHDGDLTHDAGRDAETAVPFAQSTRTGRIAEDDDGDAWILRGEAGERLHLHVENLSKDTLLEVEFQDIAGRPLQFPLTESLFASGDHTWTLEFPRGDTPTEILVIFSATRPLDYRVATEIF